MVAAAMAAGERAVRRRARRWLAAAGFLLLALPAAGTEAKGRRVALVVGNGAYEALPRLANPVADARLLAAALERRGFSVQLTVDADLAGLRTALGRFRAAAEGAEMALVYYSGHGVQVDGVNYVLGVTSALHSRADLATASVPMPELLGAITAAGPGVGVVVLDACRNNPLPALDMEPAATRSLAPSEGLARMSPQQGMLIAYATAPGQVALDGKPGENSPFASAFAHFLAQPGLEIGLLFRKISDRVRVATAGAQVPWTEAALTGAPVYLNAEAPPPTTDPMLALDTALATEGREMRRLALARFLATAPSPSLRLLAEAHLAREEAAEEVAGRRAPGLEAAVEDWQRVEAAQATTAEPMALASFLAVYGAGSLADRARARQAALGEAAAAAPAPGLATLLWPLVERGGDPGRLGEFAALFPDAPEAAAARARVELATLAGRARPAPAPPEAAPVLVTATLGTGPAPIEIPGLPGRVTLIEPPRHGRLVLSGGRQLSPSLGAAPAVAQTVAYEAAPDGRERVDAFRLEVGDTAGEARDVGVRVSVVVDACDRLAGARFDPQGVGLGRYPNEVDVVAAVPACRAAVARFPEVARFKHALGRALELAGRPEEARGLYEAAAADGHLLALTGLGGLLEAGRGGPRDLAKALDLYRRAADEGEPAAMNGLGRAYREGSGVEKSRAEAIAWFQKAAARGHSFAYNNLGALLNEAGRHAEAFELFRASAEAGDAYGFNNLGWIHERGLGVPRDLRQAIGWYEKAAAAGQPNAAINLGLLHRDGRDGLPPDPKRAAFWFADAARNGQAWGHVHLAALYATGELSKVPDLALAARLLARAAARDGGAAGEAARRRFAALPAAAATAALQKALAEHGFDPGPADGRPGARTREAIARFARAQVPPLAPDTPPVDLLGALLADDSA
jgi:TPR repeat protein